jgi:hypothetical protein
VHHRTNGRGGAQRFIAGQTGDISTQSLVCRQGFSCAPAFCEGGRERFENEEVLAAFIGQTVGISGLDQFFTRKLCRFLPGAYRSGSFRRS